MLKDVDTSPVVTAKVSTHAITLTRQSLDESSSSYLCYDDPIRNVHTRDVFTVIVPRDGSS